AGAAQLLTGEEILATTAIAGGVGVAVLVFLFPRSVERRLRHAVVGLAVAVAAFGALAAVPLLTQFFGPQRVEAEIRAPDFYVNDLLGFVVPSRLFALAPQRLVELTQRWTGNPVEWNGYVGVPLAVLLLWIAVRHRSVGLVRWTA